MRPAAAPRVFIGFTDPRSLRTEAPRLTAARCCGGWIVAARKGQPEIAHNAQPAARRLAGAADFFRNIGDRNLPDQAAAGNQRPDPRACGRSGGGTRTRKALFLSNAREEAREEAREKGWSGPSGIRGSSPPASSPRQGEIDGRCPAADGGRRKPIPHSLAAGG